MYTYYLYARLGCLCLQRCVRLSENPFAGRVSRNVYEARPYGLHRL